MTWEPPIPGPLDSPLQYATAFKPVRPGIMTAVGIASIIVGSLGILGSLSDGGSAVMYMVFSRMTFGQPAAATVVTTPAATTIPAGNGAATMPAGGPVLATGAAWPFGNIDRRAAITTIVVAALSLCVAVLLIVAGSMVMRNSRSALRLHRFYLVMKFPLIVVAALAKWWMVSGMMSGVTAMAGTNGAANFGNVMAIAQAGFSAGFSLIYPVALLIVLATKAAKEYGRRIQSNLIPEVG